MIGDNVLSRITILVMHRDRAHFIALTLSSFTNYQPLKVKQDARSLEAGKRSTKNRQVWCDTESGRVTHTQAKQR